MCTSRSRTAAAVRPILRFLVITLIALLVVEAGPAAGAVQEGRPKPDVTQTLTGTVIDQSGNALPRAYVRATDSSAREIAAAFADEAGRFRFTLPSLDCEIAASLTGFEPVTTPCTAQPLRIVLAVAPIRETVVVTATGTEAPAGLVGTSVTTYTADDLATRQTPLVADLLRASPGVMFIRAGGPGTVTSLFVRGGESNYNKVLLEEWIASGATAIIVTARSEFLDQTWLGRRLEPDCLSEFARLGVDPCGERGEYHTVVTDTPLFDRPLRLRAGASVQRADGWALDLALEDDAGNA